MQPEREERLKSVFKSVFRVSVVDGVSTVDEIEEWDSLSHIELVLALEDEFDIDIEPGEIMPLYSDFSHILEFIEKAEAR